MLDYEAIRAFYFETGAQKCATDPKGHGRFESAFFHTIKKVHDDVQAQSEARIGVLQADIKVLTGALKAHGEAAAALKIRHDDLLQAARNLRDTKGRYHTELATKRLFELLATIERGTP